MKHIKSQHSTWHLCELSTLIEQSHYHISGIIGESNNYLVICSNNAIGEI